MTPDLQHRDPSELTVHPLCRTLHQWENGDQSFIDLVENIRERGIDQPILIDAENRILDGRHRWRAAKRLQLEQVPVIVHDGAEAASVILASITHRRHYTKGQLAFILVDLFAPAFEEGKRRRLQHLKRGDAQAAPLPPAPKTTEELAERYGVSEGLLKQARAIHKAFAEHPEWEAQDKPRIFDPENPAGLGAIIAGFAGRQATKGKARPESDQLELFTGGLDSLAKRFRYWTDFDDAQKREAVEKVRDWVSRMPDDLCAEVEAAIKARRKRHA
ncbi:MAG TPA: ParB N-terminal domain-containing protein [Methylomirabilota bacterium]|nr:ParB N-terminal domain-containing protein [Methylomirabilota bacterium]